MLAPWVAGKEALKSHPSTFEWPVLPDGFKAVCAASGRVPTLGPQERRYGPLVKAYDCNEYVGKEFAHLFERIGGWDFGICPYGFHQLFDTTDYGTLYRFIIRHIVVCKDKKYMQLLVFGNDCVQAMFVQPPCLYHQPAYSVPFHRAAKFFLGTENPASTGDNIVSGSRFAAA